MDFTAWNGIDLNEVLAQTRTADNERLFGHDDLTSRLKRTLYYDPLKRPDMDTLSFSVTKSAVSCFRHAAPMPVGKLGHRYASRVARDACISPCALLLGLIYIERLKNKNPSYLEKISSSDLFLISMMVASKYLNDEGCEDEVFNDEWAISGDMEVGKVNKLEREFLGAIDWHLYVHPHEFSSMLNIAETNIALSNGCDRGWLTYSDLRSILDCHSIYKQLAQTAGILSKATCMCMIMYSGLVCLAAFTSAALVSVSQMARYGTLPLGQQQQHHAIHTVGECNNTAQEPLAFLPDPEENPLDDDAFPGFVSRSYVVSPKQVLRNRVESGQSNIFKGRPPSVITIDLPAPTDVPTLLIDEGIANADIIDTSDKPSETISDLSKSSADSAIYPAQVPQKRRPLCTMLEAVIFMAHVPAICRMKERSEGVCKNCGRYNDNSKLNSPTCRRFDAPTLPSNCSIDFDPGYDLRILLPHSSFRRPTSKYSSFRNFNPTIPPISPNITNLKLKGIPVVVH